MVGTLSDGPWNHPTHRLIRLNVRLPCLQVPDTGKVGSILTRMSEDVGSLRRLEVVVLICQHWSI